MKITIGLTKTFRHAKGDPIDYVPSMDGWRPGAEQDVVELELGFPPSTSVLRVGEAYYKATNAPPEVVESDSLATAILDELKRRQEAGELGEHRHTMDVGDTVEIDGGEPWVCMSLGFAPAASLRFHGSIGVPHGE